MPSRIMPHVAARPTHVVGDDVHEPGAPRGVGSGHHARRRARHHRVYGGVGDDPCRDGAAVTLHDQEIVGVSPLSQFFGQAIDIAAQDRLNRPVDRGSGAPFVLPIFREDGVAHRDVVVGPEFRCNFGGAAFMGRIDVRVKEMDHQRLDVQVKQRPACLSHTFFIEGSIHPTLRVHPLLHLDTKLSRNQRFEYALQAVGVRTCSSTQLQHVAESCRSYEPDLGQLPLEHRVCRRGGAVHHDFHVRQCDAGLRNRCKNAVRLVLRRARHLRDTRFSAFRVRNDQVRERAAHVDADYVISHGVPFHTGPMSRYAATSRRPSMACEPTIRVSPFKVRAAVTILPAACMLLAASAPR